MLSNRTKGLKKRCSFDAAAICMLIALVVLLVVTNAGEAASAPKTVAEIALYQRADREKMLIEGAKKEGKLIFYHANTWMSNEVTREFKKKYPFIKVFASRSGSKKLTKRIIEEYAAGRFIADGTDSRESVFPFDDEAVRLLSLNEETSAPSPLPSRDNQELSSEPPVPNNPASKL